MATKMVFVCSCGQVFDIGDSEGVAAHIDANPTHTASEGLAHTSATGVPPSLPVSAPDGTIYRVWLDENGGVASESEAGQATKLPKSRMNASTDPGVDDDASEGYEAGSRWLNTSTGEEFVCFDSTNGAAVWGSTTKGGSAVWGTDAIFAESLPPSTRTSESWGTKVILNATASEAGTYRIGWSYGWNEDSTYDDFRAQLLLAGTPLWKHRQEPKDSGGSGDDDWSQTGTDQLFRSSGFLYVDLSAGAHIFTLQWCTSDSGREASIWDAVLEFWRHS